MNRRKKVISEALNNKINMVRNVINRKRYEDFHNESLHRQYEDTQRHLYNDSQDVQLLIEGERMSDYVNTLNWMTKNGSEKR